ncbi:MAG TPA: haloalkane dehalogenase [Actinomycetota bacterium]|nr:haloalkane dehalogenase [Actinomycetota bacterium]
MPDAAALDSSMHYEEAGEGAPIVLLHGNPTSSYLWRSVVPELAPLGRCLAPDLIGFGRSGKPDIAYGFFDQARYFAAWLDALDLDDITFVGHDWGGALAFDWAARHPERVRGIAFMETYPRPQTWDEWQPPEARDLFKAFRSDKGEELILDQNLFVELVLPAGMHRKLSDEEMEAYRAPFAERQARRPMLAFPRHLPMEGEPPEVVARVEAYSEWLTRSTEVPKLLLAFEPGGVVTERVVAWCREQVASLEIQPIGAGLHYVQEDHGPAIGRAIAEWMRRRRLVPAAHSGGAEA